MLYECEKCGELAPYPISITLFDSVHMALCRTCRNAWFGYYPGLDSFKEIDHLEVVQIKLVRINEPSTGPELKQVQDALLVCKRELNEEMLRWLKEPLHKEGLGWLDGRED